MRAKSLYSFITITLCAFISGCHVLMTTEPLAKHGGEYIQEGQYVLMLKDIKEALSLSIAYDKSNAVYRVDAGKEGVFEGRCVLERSNQLLASLTIPYSSAYRSLTESEGGFIIRGYVNVRLIKTEAGYDVWALKRSKCISDGCHVSALPAQKLLPLLPQTNAPPFSYEGKLRRIGDDGGISCSDKSQVALTNVVAEDVLPAPFGIRLGTEFKPDASAKTSNAEGHTLASARSRSGIKKREGRMAARTLPEPFLGKATINILVDDAHVGYRFYFNGNYRRGLSRAESLNKIESLRAAIEKECGFQLNPYMFYVGEMPECEQTKSMPGFGADLWEDMDSVRAISLTKHGRLKVAIHCSIKNVTSSAGGCDMDAPVAVSVVFSLPDIEAAVKKRLEDEKIRLEKAKRMTLSEFCGIKFGEPSNFSTNDLERFKFQSYRMQYKDEPVTTNSYFAWLGRRVDITPPKIFDLVKVNYSYKTITPYWAEFCGHFPKGATRKECLERIDAFVADINGRYGLRLSCSGEGNRIEEEPAGFKPGEAPKNRQNHRSRYIMKDGAMFGQYHFSNPNLYVQIEAGENRYGERIVLMDVADHTCDELSEGLISPASEGKPTAK